MPATAAVASIQRFHRNTTGRDFAVGDIHGAFDALQRGLDAIRFDPQRDRLFSTGDLVDRGPQSHEVLAWLDKPWFHAVCGNHDFMAWRSALGHPYPEVDHLMHGGEWLEALPPEVRERIGQRLAALPLAFEIDTTGGVVGVVHADCPFDDWLHMHRIDGRGIDHMRSEAGQCLWSVERYRHRYAGIVRNIRAVVHGHMTIRGMEVLGNTYFIDTGGWKTSGGKFTFLALETLKPA